MGNMLTRAERTPAGPAGARPDHERSGVAAVLVTLVAFSLGAPMVKLIPLPAASVAFWRLVLGAAVLLVAAAVLRSPWPQRLGPMLVAGLCFGAHQLLFTQASQTTSIAVVTLLGALQPLLVAVVSRRTVGEAVPAPLVGWALCAVAGVAVVVQANLDAPSRSLAGDVLAAVNVVAFTAYFLAAKRGRADGAPALTFTAGALGSALLVVAPAMLLLDQPAPAAAGAWGLLVFFALVPGNGHLLLTWAHPRVSAALSSIILAGVPLLSTVWAHLMFDEPLGWRHLGGMVLVAVAIAGARAAERERGRSAPIPPA